MRDGAIQRAWAGVDADVTGRGALLDRRHFLRATGSGFGALALGWLMAREGRANGASPASPYAARPPMHLPRAKRVIHVCALGGVSHVDTFDYKPELVRRHGQSTDLKFDTFFAQPGRLMKSPFAFRQHGRTGRWVSDLLPHLAQRVDELAFVHSMKSRSANHTPATFLMNSGFTFNGFPAAGSWVSHALGSENEDLPAFVVLPDPRQMPAGGSINWTSGFLPGTHQGVALRAGAQDLIPDLQPAASLPPGRVGLRRSFLEGLNASDAARHPEDPALATRIRAYELAGRMQLAVPELGDLGREDARTRAQYGLDHPHGATAAFARNCLLARRLCERGVRFVQVLNGGQFGQPRVNWDGHEDIVANHRAQALVMDQPLAALISDLRERGLLDETLVVWTTEFGRTPITQGNDGKGRDHHPLAFTIFLAGAGIQPGATHGASDEIGYAAAVDPVEFYDVHATVLHLLGLDHKRLTFRHNGIDRRLTDVHGEVMTRILKG